MPVVSTFAFPITLKFPVPKAVVDIFILLPDTITVAFALTTVELPIDIFNLFPDKVTLALPITVTSPMATSKPLPDGVATAPAVVVTVLLETFTLLPVTGTSLGALPSAVPFANSKPEPVNT